jgi:amidase
MSSVMDNREQGAGAEDRPQGVVFEVSDLRAGYGRVPVLHGVSFALQAGEALGIVGHNGMGKTTLLKALMGLLPVASGRISVDGVDITREPAHARSRLGIAYVPQGRGILPGLTTLDNLRLAWTRDSEESEQEALDRVVALFPRLSQLLERRGGALSGGEQQLLALGRALVASPWMLLLDEPSEGVQPSIVQEIGQMLSAWRAESGLTMIVVEQNLDLVLDVANRIAVLEKGRITQMLDAAALGGGQLASVLGLGATRGSRAGAAAPRAGPAPRPAISVPAATFPPVPAPARTESFAAPPPPAAAGVPTTTGTTMATVKRPTLDQMKEIVASLQMSMSEREIGEYLEVMEGTLQAYDRLTQLPDNLPPVRYPRTPGYRPGPSENPLNAWAVKSEVRGAPYGPLVGKRVVLKDNVCLAGVPMMNGASTLEGYVPDVDATVVTRILDAGGTIVGKAHCEYFCLSGGSHTSAMGPVHNPFKYGYSAGGSSSGSGALVSSGEVEMAIGGDQGGSIRMPSCWSGCYGM